MPSCIVAHRKHRRFAERPGAFLPAGKDTYESVLAVVDADAITHETIGKYLSPLHLKIDAFDSARAFLNAANQVRYSCILLSTRLPDRSGLELFEDMVRADIHPVVCFIGNSGDARAAVRAMRGGALNFLVKPLNEQELLDAVQEAVWKDRDRHEQDSIVADLQYRHDTLTPREQQVMSILISGRRNKQIAAKIDVADGTVKAHRNQVMKKMGAKSLPALIGMAQLLGLEGSSAQELVDTQSDEPATA